MFGPNDITPDRAILANILSQISKRTLLNSGAIIGAGLAVGQHMLSQGSFAVTSGNAANSAQPNSIYLRSADFPIIGGLVPKLNIIAQLYTNDVAPAANFTLGLYPFTRPGVSGGVGVNIFTIGAVVAGSNGAAFAVPAADGLLQAVSADFDIPADGHYGIGFDLAGGATAANSYVGITALLQLKYIRP